ncbi:MAG: hypothetical protein MI754_06175 [Chromatiales bacterium]|nr:hypothetical protein [Chromatiales bacterium]
MRLGSFDSGERSGLQPTLTGIVLALGLFGAVVAGYGVANGNLILGAVPVALACVLLLSIYPTLILWLTLAVGLVAAGLAKLYFPALAEIRWLVIPLGALLVLHVLIGFFASNWERAGRSTMPPILGWGGAVVAVALLATLVNTPEPLQLARGLKGYFQMWGVLLALALLVWPNQLMRRQLPRALLVVALLQLPFVLHQYLVLVPQRAVLEVKGLVPFDVIAGTFGAQQLGGGANAMLAIFMFVVLAGLTGLWQTKVLSGKWLVLLGVLLLAPMFVNGAKVSLVFALTLFLVMFGKDVVARPGRFAMIASVVTVTLVAMLFVYSVGIDNRRVENWSGVVADIYQRNVEADQENRGTFTRGGALRYWGEQHIPADPFGALLGHGLYESRHSDGGVDLWDVSDPSLGIKNTAVSAILWDTGLLGLATVFGLIISAYLTAGRLAHYYRYDPWMAGLFLGVKAAMVIIFVSLWAKSYFGYHIAYQTMLVVLLGWLAYWDRQSRGSRIE